MDNNSSLENILNDVLSSYAAQKGTEADFSLWLANTLQEKLSEMSAEEASKLAGEIMQGVAGYNETLDDVNRAAEAGCPKEEWLAERLAESYADLPPDEAGERLLQLEDGLNAANAQLIHEIDKTKPVEVPPAVSDPAGWNEFSLKSRARKIAKGVGLTSLGVMAKAAKYRMESQEPIAMQAAIQKALQEGTPTDISEVKAAVAGAVKVAAMNSLIDGLSEDTPMETICDMAGVAVEGTEALVDVASGKSTMIEAMDRTGRAAVAAGCRYCSGALKGYIMTSVPFGPLVVKLLGGLFEHMESPQFFNNVYTVVRDMYTTVRDATVATREGAKSAVKEAVSNPLSLLS